MNIALCLLNFEFFFCMLYKYFSSFFSNVSLHILFSPICPLSYELSACSTNEHFYIYIHAFSPTQMKKVPTTYTFVCNYTLIRDHITEICDHSLYKWISYHACQMKIYVNLRGLRLFFLPNFRGTMFIPRFTSIPDFRVLTWIVCLELSRTSDLWLAFHSSLNTQSCIRRPFCTTLLFNKDATL